MDDLFKSLDINKGEWLEDIERGDSSSASFLACVEECITVLPSERISVILRIYLDEFHGLCHLATNVRGEAYCFKFEGVQVRVL